MRHTYSVRPAEQADKSAVLDLIESAAKWMQECKGTDQWARPWPDKPSRDARVEQGIKDGLTWIVEDSQGLVAATVTCREHGNDMLWTPAELAEPAAYVSRLIVSRDRAGQGLGAALVDWAGARAENQWRARWIRIDVWTTNTALHQYYKNQGFEHQRTLDFENYWDYPSAALFQKPTGAVNQEYVAMFELSEEVSVAAGRTLSVP